MSERDEYIPGVPCWVDASYKDPETVLPFYRGLFGWEFIPAIETPGQRFFIATIRGGSAAGIGELPPDHPPVPAWNTYVAVTNADEAVAKVEAAGGEVLAPAFDVVDAGRMAILKDPQGAVFCAWQAGRTKGAKVINEHGAVNFNTLHTPDREAAEQFYGEVFGWTTVSLAGAEFWTLPGYGDTSRRSCRGCARARPKWGRPGLRTSSRCSSRSRTTSSRTGMSHSRSTTPTRPPPRRPSSAATCSFHRLTLRMFV